EQRPAQEQVAHELSGSGRRVKVKSFGSARITADKVGRIVAIPVTGDEVALKDGILSEEHITVEGGRAVTEDTPASLVGRVVVLGANTALGSAGEDDLFGIDDAAPDLGEADLALGLMERRELTKR